MEYFDCLSSKMGVIDNNVVTISGSGCGFFDLDDGRIIEQLLLDCYLRCRIGVGSCRMLLEKCRTQIVDLENIRNWVDFD